MEISLKSPSAGSGTGRDTKKRGLSRKLARDLSTAPAWIASPELSGVVDLVRSETFPVDQKARPKRRRRGDDWRDLVIGASPYNRVSSALQAASGTRESPTEACCVVAGYVSN